MRKLEPTSIDGIEFDALISFGRSHEAEIPDYPVEDGFTVQDTIVLQPTTIEVVANLSDSPITFRSHGAGRGRVETVARQLEELYEQKKLVTLVTPRGIYRDMGIQSMSLPYSTDLKSSMQVTISLKQVRKVGAKTTTIPAEYGKGGATGVNAGTAQTTPATSGSGGSTAAADAEKNDSKTAAKALYDTAANAIGGLFK